MPSIGRFAGRSGGCSGSTTISGTSFAQGVTFRRLEDEYGDVGAHRDTLVFSAPPEAANVFALALAAVALHLGAQGQPTATPTDALLWMLDHAIEAWTPLGRDAIAELLTGLLGTDPSLAALATPIHARTGGNPFFTEEVAQTLIESGHLEGTRGAYRLVTPVERLQVPATVQAVLAARIDRLAEREKRLLQVASVIGKDFAEPLLAAVADLPAEALKTSLAALRRAEFIHEQAIYPVIEYAFKHPLTQEVALGSQLKERRRTVHAAVARAIEQQDAEHLDERAALLAHHWEEAGEVLSAARWHRRAAEWVGLTDFAAGTHHWGRVRALRRELPDDPEAAALGIAACRQLLSMGWRIGMGLEEARALLDEGQALANAIGDRRAPLFLSMLYGRARGGAGDVAAYLELMLENRRAALELDDIGLQAGAWCLLGDALCFAARFPEALQHVEEGLARFPRSISREDWPSGINPFTVMAFWRGFCLSWMGRLPEAVEELARARRPFPYAHRR